jgi:hypothetical protein
LILVEFYFSKKGGCDELDSNALSKYGFYSVKIRKPGVYYYRVDINKTIKIATIIAAPAEKVFTKQLRTKKHNDE